LHNLASLNDCSKSKKKKGNKIKTEKEEITWWDVCENRGCRKIVFNRGLKNE